MKSIHHLRRAEYPLCKTIKLWIKVWRTNFLHYYSAKEIETETERGLKLEVSDSSKNSWTHQLLGKLYLIQINDRTIIQKLFHYFFWYTITLQNYMVNEGIAMIPLSSYKHRERNWEYIKLNRETTQLKSPST